MISHNIHKVYCKKDAYYNGFFEEILIHKKGETYNVSHISDQYYYYIIFIEIEKNTIQLIGDTVNGYRLSINEKENKNKIRNVMSRHYQKSFYEHFLTLQEYRKQKLEKLNCIR